MSGRSRSHMSTVDRGATLNRTGMLGKRQTNEYKRDIIENMLSHNMSLGEGPSTFGIHKATIQGWMNNRIAIEAAAGGKFTLLHYCSIGCTVSRSITLDHCTYYNFTPASTQDDLTHGPAYFFRLVLSIQMTRFARVQHHLEHVREAQRVTRIIYRLGVKPPMGTRSLSLS